MNLMRSMLIGVALSCAGQAAQAQHCAELMHAFAVPKPEVSLSAGNGGVELSDCSLGETAMFLKNYNAISRAVPVTELGELYGTWLGDDVLSYVGGVTVAGQEVLRIAPDTDGKLGIEQFWIKAVAIPGQIWPWDAQLGYRGQVAHGTLAKLGNDGRYSGKLGDATVFYDGRSVEWTRDHDLFVKSRLNRFETAVDFALDDDVLVMRYETRHFMTFEITKDVVTYTKVADHAPDQAILLIVSAKLSQAQYFDCLTHQITRGQGPLLDALAPRTLAEVETMLQPYIALWLQTEQWRVDFPDATKMTDDQWEERKVLTMKLGHMYAEPEYQSLMESLGSSDLGCPNLN